MFFWRIFLEAGVLGIVATFYQYKTEPKDTRTMIKANFKTLSYTAVASVLALSANVAHADAEKSFETENFTTIHSNGDVALLLAPTDGKPRVVLHGDDDEHLSHYTVQSKDGTLTITDDRVGDVNISLFVFKDSTPDIQVTVYTPQKIQRIKGERNLTVANEHGTLDANTFTLESDRNLVATLSPKNGIRTLDIRSDRNAILTFDGDVHDLQMLSRRDGTITATTTKIIDHLKFVSERNLTLNLTAKQGAKHIHLNSERDTVASIMGKVNSVRVESERNAVIANLNTPKLDAWVGRNLTAKLCSPVTIKGKVERNAVIHAPSVYKQDFESEYSVTIDTGTACK